MPNALLFSLMLACAQAGLAQLSGPLSGTLGPGEFHVIDTIYVNAGDSLRLLPGTTFNFDGLYPFDIRGVLLAEGTETDSIIFTTDIQDARRRWRGLRFFSEGAATSSLVYCVIENAIWFDGMGGGVSCYESSPSFANTTIRGNTGRDGGGLYCWSVSSPVFEECTFVANIARQRGGGAYCASSSSPRFTGCIFSANEARNYGGGIYCQNLSSPTFTNCVVTNNQAGSDSEEGGGGVYCESSLAILDSCTISLNRAHRDWCLGGGVTCHNASPTFRNCLIEHNTADAYGGGLYCHEYSSPTFTGCTLRGNSITRTWYCGGGGVYCKSGASPIFVHCAVVENSAYWGGGVRCDHSSPSFDHCTIARNWATANGGGIHCRDYSSPSFKNCTFSGNAAGSSAGGAYCWRSTPVFNSSIIAFSEGPGFYFFECVGTRVEYCDFFGNTGGWLQGDFPGGFHDNIMLDPTFVDTAAGDFHLLAGSPCIDLGDPFSPPDPDGTVIEMGAFYFPQEPISFSISPDSLDFGSVIYRQDTTLSFWIHNPNETVLRAAGIWATDATVFHLDRSSTDIPPLDSLEIEVTFAPLRDTTYLGNIYVTFMGLDEIETVVVQGIGCFDCHVLTGGIIRGNLSAACSPYYVLGDLTIEESDTLTIQPGVELVFDAPCRLEVHGLLLAEGTTQDSIVFTCDTQFNPDRWRGIRFYNAPDSSRLEYCVIEYAKAEGGYSDKIGGGVYCWRSSPVIMHCAFRNNSADSHGGGMYCDESSPAISHCVFMNNSAGQTGGGICCDESSANVTNCLFSSNWAGTGGAIRCHYSSPTFAMCILNDNSAGAGGGVSFYHSSATFAHCSLGGNSASSGGAVHSDRSSPIFTNCVVSDNSAGVGAGVHCDRSSPSFANCTINDNTADEYGGGVYCRSESSPSFTSCTISANSSRYHDGGGVYCSYSSPAFLNCTVSTNSAHGGGGAYCSNCAGHFTNCILDANLAGTGGGVYCSSSSDTFMNCTLSGNYAGLRGGGGIYCWNSSSVFRSTIIAFSQDAGIRFRDSESSTVEHCDFFGNTGGPVSFYNWNPVSGPPNIGEISTANANGDSCDQYCNTFLDPMFVDTAAGDYHLLTGSSCIAAADTANSPPADFEGNPRPNPPGTLPDIGAYEHEDGGHPWVFDLVSPQWGDTCWTSDTTLIWHAAFNPEPNDTVSYEVSLDTLPDLSTAWEVASDLLDTTFHLTGLSDDHAYYWTVHASDLNSAGTFARSPLMLYTYFPEPLATFGLLEPEDGAELPRGEIRFCWQAADDPDPNDTIVYTLFLTTRDTSFSYPVGADTCGMLDVGSLLLDDSLAVEWWIEAHSAHPDFTIESASHFHFYPPERLPAQFALHQNWPNPFNLTTVIRYDVKQDGSVRLAIYNLLGRKVTTLVDRWHLAGSHRVSWNAADSPSGIYFCRMEAPGFVQTRKLVLVK